MRLRGLRILDDRLVCASSIEQCRSHVALLVSHVQALPESQEVLVGTTSEYHLSRHVPGLRQGLSVPHSRTVAGLQGVPGPLQPPLLGELGPVSPPHGPECCSWSPS